MAKYLVSLGRAVIYHSEVEVEADSSVEALALAEDQVNKDVNAIEWSDQGEGQEFANGIRAKRI